MPKGCDPTSCALEAVSSRQRDIILNATAELPVQHQPGGLAPQVQTANSANGAALRDGTSYPSEIAAVTVTKHCGGERRSKQPSLHITSTRCHHMMAPRHDTNQKNSIFFTAPVSQNIPTFLVRATLQHPRAGAPMVRRHRSTSTSTLNSTQVCHEIPDGSGVSSRKRSRAAGTACQPINTLGTPERFGDSTEHHQAGVCRNSLHRLPDS